MLEEAVRMVFPGSRCAALCEWEAYAAATLLARMADQSMESAPVWCGDLRDFDAAGFRGVVDILTAGLPCQPYSVAGKKQGNTDARSWGEDGDGPIPGFLRIVDACRPAVVFLENVPTWVRAGWFRPVGDELSRMGYEIVEPVFLAASDVGASHQRERVFVLAYAKLSSATRQRFDGWRGSSEPKKPCAGSDKLAYAKHARLNGGTEVAYSTFSTSGQQTEYERREDFGRGITEIFCPGPSAREWGDILRTSPTSRRRLNPAFGAWLMGWPWWWTRPEPISFAASEMALWRSRLRSRLWSFCGGQE